MSKTATIIAVKDADVDWIPEGATRTPKSWNWPDAWAGPRQTLENDPFFRQIIPYVIVKKANSLLTYVRSETGGETRLHGKGSIGVGGHIDVADITVDTEGRIYLNKTVFDAAVREIEEELNLMVSVKELKHVGFLKISETDVDRVHLGFVMVLDVTDWEEILTFEDTMDSAMFLTKADILASELELEMWSKLALDFF